MAKKAKSRKPKKSCCKKPPRKRCKRCPLRDLWPRGRAPLDSGRSTSSCPHSPDDGLCSKPARRARRRPANHEPRGGRHDHAIHRRCRLRPELASRTQLPRSRGRGARGRERRGSGRTNVLDPAQLGASPRGSSDRGSGSAGDVHL